MSVTCVTSAGSSRFSVGAVPVFRHANVGPFKVCPSEHFSTRVQGLRAPRSCLSRAGGSRCLWTGRTRGPVQLPGEVACLAHQPCDVPRLAPCHPATANPSSDVHSTRNAASPPSLQTPRPGMFQILESEREGPGVTRRLPTTKAAPERRAPGPGTLTCVSHGGRDMGCRFPAGPDRPRPAAADSMRRRIMQRRRRSRRRWRRCSSSSCRSSCWRSSSSCSSRRAPPPSASFSAIGALQE